MKFHSVLHSKNSYTEIIAFFKQSYNKIPSISEIAPIGIKSSQREQFLKMYRNAAQSRTEMGKAYRQYEIENVVGKFENVANLLHRNSGYVFGRYDQLIDYKQKKSSIPTGTCTPFSRKVFVTAKGKILPCERIGHQFSLGYIKNDHIELNFQKIAEYMNTMLDKIDNKCNHCSGIRTCEICLFQMEHECDKINCNGFLNNHTFSDYLSNAFTYLEDNPGIYKRMMGLTKL